MTIDFDTEITLDIKVHVTAVHCADEGNDGEPTTVYSLAAVNSRKHNIQLLTLLDSNTLELLLDEAMGEHALDDGSDDARDRQLDEEAEHGS